MLSRVIYNKNIKEPRTEPCGTPHNKGTESDMIWLNLNTELYQTHW